MIDTIENFLAQLDDLRREGVIRHIDVEFPRMIAEIEQNHPETALLALLTQLAQSGGHTCFPAPNQQSDWEHFVSEQDENLHELLAESEKTITALITDKSSLFDKIKTFDFEFNSIYTHRYKKLEQDLAQHFSGRFKALPQWMRAVEHHADQLGQFLNATYGGKEFSFELDESQKEAIVRSLLFQASVITGGPGTGKTTTARRILEAHLLLWPDDKSLPVIEIAAPTGKAASRLSESLSNSADESELLSEEKLQCIPTESQTIHRLIGLGYHNKPKHNADFPVDADIIVIDEASMIDQQLMYYLLEAIRSDTKLIFLGDKNQLPSVEAGAVLSQLYPETSTQQNLLDHYADLTGLINEDERSEYAVAELEVGHRAGEDSGITQLALQMQRNEKPVIDPSWTDIEISNYKDSELLKELRSFTSREQQFFSELISPEDAFERIKKEQFLSVTNKGRFGADDINSKIASLWQDERAIYEPGMRIIIKQNDYQNGLFNGEIGVYLRDPEQPEKSYFYFEAASATGAVRKFLPEQLHKFELAFALSVHKSQGSEYEKVTLIEPRSGDKRHPLFMKELLYTAITRSRKKFIFRGNKKHFEEAAITSNIRYSNLGLRIWG